MPALDLRRTNPFVYLHAEVRAGLTDPAKARAVLPEVAEALAPVLHAEISRAEVEGVEVFTIRYHLGEGMSFGIIGDSLVATGGEGAFAAAVLRAKEKAAGFSKAQAGAPFLPSLRSKGSASAVLQIDRLLVDLGEVDAERLGGGPGGMAAALAFRKLGGTLVEFDHLALRFDAARSAIEAQLSIALVPPEDGPVDPAAARP